MTDFQTDPDYEESLVTFFDVLGFKNLLRTRSGAEIARLLRTFRQVSQGDEIEMPIRSDEVRLSSEVHAEIVGAGLIETQETLQQVMVAVDELLGASSSDTSEEE